MTGGSSEIGCDTRISYALGLAFKLINIVEVDKVARSVKSREVPKALDCVGMADTEHDDDGKTVAKVKKGVDVLFWREKGYLISVEEQWVRLRLVEEVGMGE